MFGSRARPGALLPLKILLGLLGKSSQLGTKCKFPSLLGGGCRPEDNLRSSFRRRSKLKTRFPRGKLKKSLTKTSTSNNNNNNNPTRFVFLATTLIFIDFYSANLEECAPRLGGCQYPVTAQSRLVTIHGCHRSIHPHLLSSTSPRHN